MTVLITHDIDASSSNYSSEKIHSFIQKVQAVKGVLRTERLVCVCERATDLEKMEEKF